MAKLTTKKRNELPASTFAGPGRSFPIPDKSHARNALARASQGVNAGTLSDSAAAKIKTKAHRVLGNGDGDGSHWSGR